VTVTRPITATLIVLAIGGLLGVGLYWWLSRPSGDLAALQEQEKELKQKIEEGTKREQELQQQIETQKAQHDKERADDQVELVRLQSLIDASGKRISELNEKAKENDERLREARDRISASSTPCQRIRDYCEWAKRQRPPIPVSAKDCNCQD
jgi:chromosome segregation ATPase